MVTVHLWEKSAQARTLRQELVWKPWRSAACWLAICDLLNLLSYKTQSHLSRGGLTTQGGLDYLHPSFYRKHPHRLAFRLDQWEQFFNCISLFLEPFHWCRADEAHHRTSKTNRCKNPTGTKRLVSRKETIWGCLEERGWSTYYSHTDKRLYTKIRNTSYCKKKAETRLSGQPDVHQQSCQLRVPPTHSILVIPTSSTLILATVVPAQNAWMDSSSPPWGHPQSCLHTVIAC